MKDDDFTAIIMLLFITLVFFNHLHYQALYGLILLSGTCLGLFLLAKGLIEFVIGKGTQELLIGASLLLFLIILFNAEPIITKIISFFITT